MTDINLPLLCPYAVRGPDTLCNEGRPHMMDRGPASVRCASWGLIYSQPTGEPLGYGCARLQLNGKPLILVRLPEKPGPAPVSPAKAGKTVDKLLDAEKKDTCHYCCSQVPEAELAKVQGLTGIRCCLKCSKNDDIIDRWKKERV